MVLAVGGPGLRVAIVGGYFSHPHDGMKEMKLEQCSNNRRAASLKCNASTRDCLYDSGYVCVCAYVCVCVLILLCPLLFPMLSDTALIIKRILYLITWRQQKPYTSNSSSQVSGIRAFWNKNLGSPISLHHILHNRFWIRAKPPRGLVLRNNSAAQWASGRKPKCCQAEAVQKKAQPVSQ